jgi:hypothetical protein
MTTKKTDTSTERDGVPMPVDDPAVVAAKEAAEAIAACCATDIDTPEFKAAQERAGKADAAFADAPVTSVAGALAKMRELVDLGSDDASTSLHSRHIKTVIAFLEGCTGAAEPDPVVALFAKWGAIQDEADAYSAANPKATDPEIDRLWNEAIDRRYAVEDQIMDIPATSMRSVAIKIRIASHYAIDTGDLEKRYATPARDINYVEANGGPLGGLGGLISALCDAERLAGTS